ncbi:2-dehydropantoate 2-reductase [Cladorrhinum sp. PSN259]|nr:2-dehydropantoate 2-reductase [Cladorrhinum sp. PSN259]
MASNSAIYILGLGNMGKFVAHSLRKYNPEQPISLVFHKDTMFDAWRQEGSGITSIRNGVSDYQGGFDVVGCESLKHGLRNQPIRNLIVATKSYSTVDAIRDMAHLLDKDSNILFLQNGMGAPDLVSEQLFPARKTRPTYYAGICSAGVHNNTNSVFTFVQAGLGPIRIGQIGMTCDNEEAIRLPPLNNPLLAAFTNAGPALLTSVLTPKDIYIQQLSKLAVNAIINPLTAIFGCRNGKLFQNKQRIQVIRNLISEEVGPVIRTLLPKDTLELEKGQFQDDQLYEIARKTAEATGENYSSMLKDVKDGRQTEIEFILGYLQREAWKRHRLETPQIKSLIYHVNKLKKEYFRQDGKCLTLDDRLYCTKAWKDIDWSNEH